MIYQEMFNGFETAMKKANELFENTKEDIYTIESKKTVNEYYVTNNLPFLLKDERTVGVLKVKTI